MLNKEYLHGVIKSLGLVFGDIGTSPIYTLTVIFALTKTSILPRTPENIIGVLSLIVWTLIILVSMEYAWLAMSLGKKGEGGTIVLREILVPLLKSGRKVAIVTILSFVGISLLIGDGVITPAISILSAVEGLEVVPGLGHFFSSHNLILILIASVIAIALFAFQKKGTERVAGVFGPIMLIWFAVLSISGIAAIIDSPQVILSISPLAGLKFLIHHGLLGFIILSEVILCATGGEALYADMGHLGRKPIIRAWYLVFFALILNYLGQGAFLLKHTAIQNTIIFEMVLNQTGSKIFYVLFLILSIIATVIASQAMISGMFSIVYQGITTRIMPMFKVDYTSAELRSQIYISFVNWFLLFFVLWIMFYFKKSDNLAAAYGLAVTGTMTITGITMTWIFYLKKKFFLMFSSIFVMLVDFIFLLSNTSKIPHGGYWSIIIATIPLLIILIYTQGQRRLYRSLKPMDINEFLPQYNKRYKNKSKIEGTALYFARDARKLPPYIVNTMFVNNIIYEDNIIVSLNIQDEPFGVTGYFKETLADGLRTFEVAFGYMEVIDVESILNESEINEVVIFYGLEDIVTDNPVWKIFAMIKSLTPSYVQFYKLPANKLHGVITRISM